MKLYSRLDCRSLFVGFLGALLVVSSPVSVYAQVRNIKDTACGVTPSRTLFRNQRREEVALFFLNHQPKLQIDLLEFLATNKKKSERASVVKEVLDAGFLNKRALDEVLNTIGDLYIQKKLAWLGVEKESDETSVVKEQELNEAATAIEKQLKKDRVKVGDIKAFMILQMGPVFYARWKNSALQKTARLVALDDMTTRMRARAYSEKLQDKADELLKDLAHSGIRTSDMERIIEISQIDLFTGVKEKSPEYLSLLARITKPEIKKLVEDYRRWIEQGVDAFHAREQTVGKLILSQKGHGLILLSKNLGPGVSDILVKSCMTGQPAARGK